MSKLANYMDRKGISNADLPAHFNRDRFLVTRLRCGSMQLASAFAEPIKQVKDGAIPVNAMLDEHSAL